MRAGVVVLGLVAACARTVDLSTPVEIDRVAFLVVEDGQVLRATGLYDARSALPSFSDPEVGRFHVVGFTREAIERLRPPDEGTIGSGTLLVASSCEPTLGVPAWAGVLDGDVALAIEPESLPRLVPSWLRDRCPCGGAVHPEDYDLETHELPGTEAAPLVPFVIALDDVSVVIAPVSDSAQLVRVSTDGVEMLAGALPEAVHPARGARARDGRMWIVGPYGDVWVGTLGAAFERVAPPAGVLERVGELAAITARDDGVVVADWHGLHAFAGGSSTTLFDPEWIFLDAASLADLGEAGVAAAWSARRERYRGIAPRLAVVDGDDVREVVPLPVRDEGYISQIAAHPTLGLVLVWTDDFAVSDTILVARDVDSEWRSVLDPSLRTGEQVPVSSIAPYEGGLVFGDGFGRLSWASPEDGERLFQAQGLIARHIAPLRYGFAVVAKNLYVPLAGFEPTNLQVTIARRRDCFGLPAD